MGVEEPRHHRIEIHGPIQIKYKFDKEEDTIIEERPIDIAPYPDVPAEAPWTMTQHENLIDGGNVIEDEPVLSNKEQAMLVEKILGLNLEL